jgi:hypothetical protein
MIFLLCLAFISSFWANAVTSANAQASRDSLALSGLLATDALFQSSGNWTGSSASEIGLANNGSPNEINYTKLILFQNLASSDMASASALLGLKKPFYMKIQNVSSNWNMTLGNPDSNSNSAFAITRYVVLNGSVAKVDFFVQG